MPCPRRFSSQLRAATLSLTLALAQPALADSTPAKPEPPTLELSASANRTAVNDLARATIYVEQTGGQPGDLAQRVNSAVARLLATAKTVPAVKARSGGTQTYPVYAKNGGRIESWRMRSELELESRDMTAMSELLGKLQGEAAVGQLVLSPSPETLRQVEDDAMVAALQAFQARAERAAKALGKRYRVRQINVGMQGVPLQPVWRASGKAVAYAAEAAPAPVEAGDTQVTVTASGAVELID